MDIRRLNFVLLLFFYAGVLVHGSPCSITNRAANMTACLTAVEDLMFDNSKFWFGDDYTMMCGSDSTSPQCTNMRPSGTNIALRTFDDASIARNIDRFVELHFESGGKNYTACGNKYMTEEHWSMDIDPTSDDIVLPWYVRHFPVNISWDFTEGEYFTLMVYDVSYLISHGIYTNIQGDDMSTADVIKEYHGPLSTMPLHIPYTFMLFRQKGRVTVSQEWIQKVNSAWGVAWTTDQFITAIDAREMVGINWFTATGDEYASQIMMEREVLSTCPSFLTTVLHQNPRPFVPNNTALTVWVDVTFQTTPLSYTVCCRDYTYTARNLTLNPMGSPVYKTWDVKTATPFTVSLLKQGVYPAVTDFTGDLYSLVTIDPDVPISTVGTEERPLLHGLIANIQDGDINTGEVVQTYMGPAPPDFKVHTYYMLLYKQTDLLNSSAISGYAGSSCSSRLAGRCLFDINRLVSENNLTLVGATWLRARTDDYVLHGQIDRALGIEEPICKGQSGYVDSSCPVDSSVSLTLSTLCAICFVIVHAIKYSV